MSNDKTSDSGTEYPGDAGPEEEDDTLDLTEAMAVPPSANGDDDTVDLANVTTVIGDAPGLGPGADAPAESEADEAVVDLAALADPAPSPPAFDADDDEFAEPRQTVAIAPEEYARLGLSRREAAEAPAPATGETDFSAASDTDPSDEAAIRERETEAPGDDTLREQPTDVDASLMAGGDPLDAPTETGAEDDDNGAPFWDIDTGTLVAMGKEFGADDGPAEDPPLNLGGEAAGEDQILDLGAAAAASDDAGRDGEVLDLGAAASPADPADDDDVLDLGAVAAPANGSGRDAETASAPSTDAADGGAGVDPVDRDAATVFMSPDADEQEAATVVMPVDGEPTETSAAGPLTEDESGPAASGERDAETMFIPGLAEPEGAAASEEPGATDRDAETVFLSAEMAAGGEIGGEDASASQETPSSNGAESASAAAIPPGGFSEWEASRSDAEGEEGAEAADPDAETLLMSLGDWGAEEEETDPAQLSALELLDSISELPNGTDAETDEMTAPDDEAAPSGDMAELYGLLETSRISEAAFGGAAGEEGAPAKEGPDGTGDESIPAPEASAASNGDDGAEAEQAPNAVALPEARRRSDSGEERYFSITPDQMQTILERVVDKIFSEKIEKILTDVIERAVADEMRKLESYFFEELDDRGDH
jgi:hypothetical protein